MNRLDSNIIRQFEEHAQNLITLMFMITEKRITEHPAPPALKSKALAASALTLHDAVKTFLAVYYIE
jgi:hypothetical protein